MINFSSIRIWLLVSFCSVFICSLSSVVAQPLQNNGNPDRNKPLEITANESLEWHRSDLFFLAKKDVKAKQGSTTLYCDSLIARYRDSKNTSSKRAGNINIYLVEALGNVSIVSANGKAYGDKAIYNIDKGYAEITGKHLRLISEDQNVHAKDKLLYWVAQGRLEAIGDAVAVRNGDKIEADKLVATFSDNSDGKRKLKTLEGIGHVKITMPEEVVIGDHAYYDSKIGIAKVKGNVRIVRGDSFLEGERAQVDLNTNISKIFGSRSDVEKSAGSSDGDGNGVISMQETDKKGKKRVRAVFFPKNI